MQIWSLNKKFNTLGTTKISDFKNKEMVAIVTDYNSGDNGPCVTLVTLNPFLLI